MTMPYDPGDPQPGRAGVLAAHPAKPGRSAKAKVRTGKVDAAIVVKLLAVGCLPSI
jgi:hypothetical protein